MATIIKRCNCKHAGQDKIHGKGLRVQNTTDKGYRCTACGKDTDRGRA